MLIKSSFDFFKASYYSIYRSTDKEESVLESALLKKAASSEDELFNKIFKDDLTLSDIQHTTSKFEQLMAYYKCAIMEIETKFNVLNEQFSLGQDRTPINGMKSRLKSPKSILTKLMRKNLPITFTSIEETLADIAGIRIICSFVHDVYLLADALLSQDDVTLIETKDYIKNPKENGYRSLHLIVSVPIFLLHEKRQMKVEIQLRTIAMDSWATLEHQLKYKKDTVFTEEMAHDLYLCSQLSSELDTRMDNLRKQCLE